MADISSYLDNIRRAESGETVRDSIINCLSSINNDQPIKTKPLDVTENGTYSSNGYAYSPVTVHVAGSSSYKFKELEVTENGEYEPEKGEMFNKVVVDVDMEKDIMKDPLVINQNGEWDALQDGYYGYSKVVVNVTEATGNGPFTVNFFDSNGTVIATQSVPKYGNANCTLLDGTTKDGLYFNGWNPSPTNVTRDLDCKPSYGDYIIDPGQIQDTWDVVCANGGSKYPIGAYKVLTISPPPASPDFVYVGYDYSEGSIFKVPDGCSFTARMVKVAQGESGSSSTWISNATICVPSTCLAYEGNGHYRTQNMYSCMTLDGDGCSYWSRSIPYTDWGNCFMRWWLNNVVITNFPESLQRNIKTVQKWYTGHTNAGTKNGGNVLLEKSSLDRIWVPSIKEFKTKFQSYSAYAGSAFETYTEGNGIDYYQELGIVDPSNIPLFDEDNMYPYDGSTDNRYNDICFRTSVSNKHHGFGWLNDIRYKTDPSAARIGSDNPDTTSKMYRQVLIGFCL